jgi:hypothetical protein
MLPAPLSNLLVLSPHCDDAVLACGEMLEAHPGSVVATVFAGCPPAGAPLTEWDRAAGFQAGDDVMNARRAEDLAFWARSRSGSISSTINTGRLMPTRTCVGRWTA